MTGSTNFPGAVDVFSALSPAKLSTPDSQGRDHGQRHDDMDAAVAAVESAIVNGPITCGGGAQFTGLKIAPGVDIPAFAGSHNDNLMWRVGGVWYDEQHSRLHARTYMCTEFDDPSELALRRVDNDGAGGPKGLVDTATIGLVHWTGAITDGDHSFQSRSAQIYVRAKGNITSTNGGGDVLIGTTPQNTVAGAIDALAIRSTGEVEVMRGGLTVAGGETVGGILNQSVDEGTAWGSKFINTHGSGTPKGSLILLSQTGSGATVFEVGQGSSSSSYNSRLKIDGDGLVTLAQGLTAGGALIAQSTLAVTGAATLSSTLAVTSTISASGLAGSLLSSANPIINGTAAPGTAAVPSRQDHVHPTDTTRAPTASPTFTGTVTIPNVNLGAGTAYTPTFVNLTVGAGTIDFRSWRVGNQVHVVGRFVMAADSSISGAPTFTLPTPAVAVTQTRQNRGLSTFYDSGTETYYGTVALDSTTVASCRKLGVTGSNVITSAISSTVPMTWTTNDEYLVDFWYEAA